MQPVWLIDGYAAYGHQIHTLRTLQDKGAIVVRHDLLLTVERPETVKTYRGVAGGMKTMTLPARQEPADPGWRANVEVTGRN